MWWLNQPRSANPFIVPGRAEWPQLSAGIVQGTGSYRVNELSQGVPHRFSFAIGETCVVRGA